MATEAELSGYDLVVGADGVQSFVRRLSEAAFGTRVEFLSNRFVWYGTTRAFETLSQTLVVTPFGPMNAHHYRYAPAMSTFIAECDAATWQRAGFETMNEAETRTAIESAFADALQGHPLVANKSIWRRFPKIRNEHWSVGNRVLVGDALPTAHFSIGSGTRLAFEDAIALAEALRDQGDVPAALQAYETARRPIVDKLVGAANRSADWYEHFGEHMRLDPWRLAWSYIQRSGRIDVDRLRQVSPRFVAEYEARIQTSAGDAVRRAAPDGKRASCGSAGYGFMRGPRGKRQVATRWSLPSKRHVLTVGPTFEVPREIVVEAKLRCGDPRSTSALAPNSLRLKNCSQRRRRMSNPTFRMAIPTIPRQARPPSAAGNWMVGPPFSWSFRDQEDASWQARFADRPRVGPQLP